MKVIKDRKRSVRKRFSFDAHLFHLWTSLRIFSIIFTSWIIQLSFADGIFFSNVLTVCKIRIEIYYYGLFPNLIRIEAMKTITYFPYALGILFSFCLIVTLLITSVEAVTYWTPGYYEREYSKYNVTEDVHMEMDDLLDVTKEMMAYLQGNREDLHVPTIVDGPSGNSSMTGRSPIWRMSEVCLLGR